MIGGHGGNIYKVARDLGCSQTEIVDMSSNINPLGPPPGLLAYLEDNISLSTRLPEVDSAETVSRFAGFLSIDSDRILAGNGTTQFIYAVPQALGIRRAIVLGPTYSDYADACKLHGIPHTIVAAEESAGFGPDLDRIENEFSGADTVFVCNPNNPTGSYIGRYELIRLCQRHPEIRFIVDESYLPFLDQGRAKSLVDAELENVIVLLSISKIFAIPGLRIGFLVAPVKKIDHFRPHLLPWSVNSLAQSAVYYLTTHNDLIRSFVDKTRRFLKERRREFDRLTRPLTSIRFFPSPTPFFLAKLPPWTTADSAWTRLADERLLIRNCSNFYGLSDRFIRISLKSWQLNRVLVDKLEKLAVNPCTSCPDLEIKRTISA